MLFKEKERKTPVKPSYPPPPKCPPPPPPLKLKIIIEAEPQAIAALVLAVQERQEKYKVSTDDIDRIARVLAGSIVEAGRDTALSI